jgi:hypothetical protein
MESRLHQIMKLHEKAMNKFKMNQLTALLFFKAEEILNQKFVDVPHYGNAQEIHSDLHTIGM